MNLLLIILAFVVINGVTSAPPTTKEEIRSLEGSDSDPDGDGKFLSGGLVKKFVNPTTCKEPAPAPAPYPYPGPGSPYPGPGSWYPGGGYPGGGYPGGYPGGGYPGGYPGYPPYGYPWYPRDQGPWWNQGVIGNGNFGWVGVGGNGGAIFPGNGGNGGAIFPGNGGGVIGNGNFGSVGIGNGGIPVGFPGNGGIGNGSGGFPGNGGVIGNGNFGSTGIGSGVNWFPNGVPPPNNGGGVGNGFQGGVAGNGNFGSVGFPGIGNTNNGGGVIVHPGRGNMVRGTIEFVGEANQNPYNNQEQDFGGYANHPSVVQSYSGYNGAELRSESGRPPTVQASNMNQFYQQGPGQGQGQNQGQGQGQYNQFQSQPQKTNKKETGMGRDVDKKKEEGSRLLRTLLSGPEQEEEEEDLSIDGRSLAQKEAPKEEPTTIPTISLQEKMNLLNAQRMTIDNQINYITALNARVEFPAQLITTLSLKRKELNDEMAKLQAGSHPLPDEKIQVNFAKGFLEPARDVELAKAGVLYKDIN